MHTFVRSYSWLPNLVISQYTMYGSMVLKIDDFVARLFRNFEECLGTRKREVGHIQTKS